MAAERVPADAVSLPRKRLALKPRGKALLLTAFGTLGAVYGDIATSPICGIFPSDGGLPAEDDVVGAVSAIIWAITLIALLKYAVFATAFASSEGEGGCFSLFTSIYRVLEPEDDDDFAAVPGLSIFRFDDREPTDFFRRQSVKWLLLIIALFGTALTLADGTLTPCVSVTSAVEGLALNAPSLHGKTYGIAIAILVLIFGAQRLGTHRISVVFAPVVLLWLLLLFATGIANVTHHPGIWRAFDISRAVAWFVRTRDFWSLASVALSITGCEAMFAGLGHFSPGAMRLSFLAVVYPALCLQYLGQGARLISDGEQILPSIFFQSLSLLSPVIYWIGWVLSILATVIASQALITASFSLYQQLESFQCAPSIRITHTSDEHPGQVYVGKLNWVLAAVCIALTAGFQTSERLTHAYVLSTTGVMLLTTLLIAISTYVVKGLPWLAGAAFLLVFGFVEACFFGASTRRIVQGAWYSVGVGVLIGLFMLAWFFHANLELAYDLNHRTPLTRLLSPHATLSEEAEAKAGRGAVEVQVENPLSRVQTRERDDGRSRSPSPDRFGGSGKLSRVNSVSRDMYLSRVNTTTSMATLLEKALEPFPPLYLVPHPSRIALSRPPIFALFHTTSSLSRGAPPALTGFLQRYPALPRVTCMFTIRVMAIPHVEEEDRILLAAYPAQSGVYEVVLRIGFRDEVNLVGIHKPIGRKLLALEARSAKTDPEGARRRRECIVEAAASSSIHIIPTYHLRGRDVMLNVPFLGRGLTMVRWACSSFAASWPSSSRIRTASRSTRRRCSVLVSMPLSRLVLMCARRTWDDTL